ncbi:hypothetical protein B0H19DRAFT_1065924 [Mycena capillaripes]|nr:hypothetical protein B0H19DRAFT_1065924 [Mycena capillaripes]
MALNLPQGRDTSNGYGSGPVFERLMVHVRRQKYRARSRSGRQQAVFTALGGRGDRTVRTVPMEGNMQALQRIRNSGQPWVKRRGAIGIDSSYTARRISRVLTQKTQERVGIAARWSELPIVHTFPRTDHTCTAHVVHQRHDPHYRLDIRNSKLPNSMRDDDQHKPSRAWLAAVDGDDPWVIRLKRQNPVPRPARKVESLLPAEPNMQPMIAESRLTRQTRLNTTKLDYKKDPFSSQRNDAARRLQIPVHKFVLCLFPVSVTQTFPWGSP